MVERFDIDLFPWLRLLECSIGGPRDFDSVPVIRVVLFKEDAAIRNLTKLLHFVRC